MDAAKVHVQWDISSVLELALEVGPSVLFMPFGNNNSSLPTIFFSATKGLGVPKKQKAHARLRKLLYVRKDSAVFMHSGPANFLFACIMRKLR
jgi:hypothetical protein